MGVGGSSSLLRTAIYTSRMSVPWICWNRMSSLPFLGSSNKPVRIDPLDQLVRKGRQHEGIMRRVQEGGSAGTTLPSPVCSLSKCQPECWKWFALTIVCSHSLSSCHLSLNPPCDISSLAAISSYHAEKVTISLMTTALRHHGVFAHQRFQDARAKGK